MAGKGAARIGAAMVAILLAGCGRGEVERVPVSGRVTLDGRPLVYGSILFTPAGGTRGPRAGGTIQNGVYDIAQTAGPLPGELTVEIRAPKLSPGSALPADESARFRLAAEAAELLPDRYHAASTLKVTAASERENHFDFSLTSDSQ